MDRDREIVHSHNLFKLLALCSETNRSFDQLMDIAGLLTPFAVEARYDTEFWPTLPVVEQAQLAANRVAQLVALLVPSAATMLPGGVREWKDARDRFDWRVDLRHFK